MSSPREKFVDSGRGTAAVEVCGGKLEAVGEDQASKLELGAG